MSGIPSRHKSLLLFHYIITPQLLEKFGNIGGRLSVPACRMPFLVLSPCHLHAQHQMHCAVSVYGVCHVVYAVYAMLWCMPCHTVSLAYTPNVQRYVQVEELTKDKVRVVCCQILLDVTVCC